jgi:hypothetical protein
VSGLSGSGAPRSGDRGASRVPGPSGGSASRASGDPGTAATGAQRPGDLDRPVGLCLGPGHIVVQGNAAFVAEFGAGSVGLPAREGMLDLPPDAFAVLDAVFASGRPLARWIVRDGDEWRLTVAPRVDPVSGETYGVTFHLRLRSDVPVLRTTG